MARYLTSPTPSREMCADLRLRERELPAFAP